MTWEGTSLGELEAVIEAIMAEAVTRVSSRSWAPRRRSSSEGSLIIIRQIWEALCRHFVLSRVDG